MGSVDVKWLSFSSTYSIINKSLKDEGRGPESLLPPISKRLKAERLPMDSGICPEKELSDSSSISKEASLDIAAGRLPDIEVLEHSIISNDFKFPITNGNEPVNKFLFKSSSFNMGKSKSNTDELN